MINFRPFSWILLIASLFMLGSCERRPLEDDEFSETALIPVKIDWSKTGFSQARSSNGDYVHRVSVRFFPKDGSPAFDRYLEGNINEGEISIPLGSYSIVIFNESIDDIYWQDAIRFTDVDKYSEFAANSIEGDKSPYNYFAFAFGEKLIVEPKRLASWSLNDFEVTKEMITKTRSKNITNVVSRASENMVSALSEVTMRPLTYQVNITATVQYLSSAQKMTGLQRGFANKVYMASAKTDSSPVSYAFALNDRRWTDSSQTHGVVENSFLTFGPLSASIVNSRYVLDVDALLTTNERYTLSPPLTFDVTEKIHASMANNLNQNIDVDISILLPKVEGGIHVGDWDEETIVIK